ncbi:MAG: hypothetical protein R3F11_26455 [Verrucomicrobiales bacterium]
MAYLKVGADQRDELAACRDQPGKAERRMTMRLRLLYGQHRD